MRALYALTISAALLGGCTLTTADLVTLQTNACKTDADCGANGKCAPVDGERACVARSSDLGTVILEVRPAADVQGNVVSHVFTDALTASGEFAGGAVETVSLAIPPNVTFQGELIAGAPHPPPQQPCTGVDGSAPAKVELRSVPTYAAFQETYTTTTQLVDGKYVYSVDVPSGTYDVYVSPLPFQATTCGDRTLPPRLIPGVDVTKNVSFVSNADTLSRVYGTLLVPTDRSVAGWHVEVVDPKYGLVISDSPPLPDQNGATSLPILGGADGKDPQGLRYYYSANPIIRVRDAQGKLVVHWTLDGVNPLGTGKVSLNLNDLLANPIALQANVIDQNASGVASSVTIQSKYLTGDTQTQSSFREVAETDGQGQFNVALVPGSYDVFVSPKTEGVLAGVQATWDVKAGTLGHGTSFVLPPAPKVRGSVVTMSGAPLALVPVVAAPHAAGAMTYFDKFAASSTTRSRDANIATDGAGSFSFPVDPATVDFSVRPSAMSRFSWLVEPQVVIDPAAMTPVHDFKRLTMPSPVLVVGTVGTGDGAVPSAVVRAYAVAPAPMGLSPNTAPSVVQIGEAVTDGAGHFELPLPPSISRATTP